MSLTGNDTPSRGVWVGLVLTWFARMLAGAQSMAARGIRGSRDVALRWRRPAAGLLLSTTLITVTAIGIGFYHIYLDRTNLPDLEPFVRFGAMHGSGSTRQLISLDVVEHPARVPTSTTASRDQHGLSVFLFLL
jgi:hypothetical protein